MRRAGIPSAWRPRSLAEHEHRDPATGRYLDRRLCPACDPVNYAAHAARHRAAS